MDVIESPGVPPRLRIVNVVGTFVLGVGLNLMKLATEYRDVFPLKYNPDKFAAATLNFSCEGMGQMTALIFSTGNVVLTGAVCEELSRDAAWALARTFNELVDIPASVVRFKMRNMVSSFKLGFEVELYDLKAAIGDRVVFQPRTFPAAIMRGPFDTKEVILTYDSGGVVITGCKKRSNIRLNHVSIYNTASLYKGVPKESSFDKHQYRLKGMRKDADEDSYRKLNKLITSGVNKRASRHDVLYQMIMSPKAPMQLTQTPFEPPPHRGGGAIVPM